MPLALLRSTRTALLALGLALLASAADAQIPEEGGGDTQAVHRPSSIGRIVRHFDFEERGFNALDIPLYWIRAQDDPEVRQRPGFPITNLGLLDYTSPTSSGSGSVRLPTTGGSTSLQLEPGVVPVFPSVRYAVGAMVRVESLEHARARLVARLLDEAGRPIEGAQAERRLEPTGSDWPAGFTPIMLELPPAPAHAASVQIDLELAQPRQLGAGGPAAFELWHEDYGGSVWFDDVVVVQLPSATLAAERESRVFLANERPTLLATIRDLSGDPIEVDLRVRDMDGAVVAHRTEQFGMGLREFAWQPELPALGWYEAELVVRVGPTPMLALLEPFAWLPGAPPSSGQAAGGGDAVPDRAARATLDDHRRMGLVLPGIATRGLDDAAGEILDRSGARSLLASVRVHAEPGRPAAANAWAALAGRLSTLRTRLGVRTTAVLEVEQPADGGVSASGGDYAFLALDDGRLWDDVLVGLVDRLAESVERWHIGPLGSDALAATPGNAARLGDIATRLDRLAPDPIVGAPWLGLFDVSRVMLPVAPARPAGVAPKPDRRWALAVAAPAHADGDWVAETSGRLGSLIKAGRAHEGLVVLHPLDPAVHGRRAAVSRLAEQVLAFWDTLPAVDAEGRGGGLGLALAGAYARDAGDSGPGRPVVSPALAAWRGLGDRLAGRRRIYAYTDMDGVRASIYAPAVDRVDGGGGLLVLRAPPGAGAPYVELYLGEAPVAVYDVFGNKTMVAPTEAPEPFAPTPRLVHRVPLGDLPVFVEGVDVDMLMFIASLRLEPDLLAAIDAEHEAALVMANPWPGVTSVRVRVVSPGGFGGQPVSERSWEIAPRVADLLLEGGQERRTPINIRFRRSEPAGRKHLGLELDIRGEDSARRVRVDVPFRIGLDYLDVIASARRTGEGVLVLAEIRNLGDRAVTLEATAIAPGAGRQRAVVARLAPGATARRELLLRGVSAAGDARVLLAIEDVDVGARLNYQVEVP